MWNGNTQEKLRVTSRDSFRENPRGKILTPLTTGLFLIGLDTSVTLQFGLSVGLRSVYRERMGKRVKVWSGSIGSFRVSASHEELSIESTKPLGLKLGGNHNTGSDVVVYRTIICLRVRLTLPLYVPDQIRHVLLWNCQFVSRRDFVVPGSTQGTGG